MEDNFINIRLGYNSNNSLGLCNKFLIIGAAVCSDEYTSGKYLRINPKYLHKYVKYILDYNHIRYYLDSNMTDKENNIQWHSDYAHDFNLFDLNKLYEYFKCPDDIKKVIFENIAPDIENRVAINVRRGDYLYLNSFIVLSKNYYKKCYEKYYNNEKLIIVSDDIKWCKENLNDLNDDTIFYHSDNYLYDFYLLTFCKGCICSCSTFSIFSQYLNKNKNCIIPERFVKDFWNIYDIMMYPDFAILEHLEYDDYIKPYDIALCCIASLENKYIRDWIKHYKDLGFSHIYICDNNFNDSEYFEDVILDYMMSGYVTVINYRDKISPQLEAYNYVYNNYKDKHNWIAFFDVDEFLILHKHNNINDYVLDIYDDSNVGAILINWKCYGDSDKLYYDNENILKRLNKPLSEEKNGQIFYFDDKYIYNFPMNVHIKSIVKCNMEICEFNSPHAPTIADHMYYYLNNGDILCHAPGSCCELSVNNVGDGVIYNINNYEYAQLNHYITKTIHEYVLQKQKRIGADMNRIEDNSYNLDYFKMMNEWDENKQKIYDFLTKYE